MINHIYCDEPSIQHTKHTMHAARSCFDFSARITIIANYTRNRTRARGSGGTFGSRRLSPELFLLKKLPRRQVWSWQDCRLGRRPGQALAKIQAQTNALVANSPGSEKQGSKVLREEGALPRGQLEATVCPSPGPHQPAKLLQSLRHLYAPEGADCGPEQPSFCTGT